MDMFLFNDNVSFIFDGRVMTGTVTYVSGEGYYTVTNDEGRFYVSEENMSRA
jgi:hypothetical protein